MAWMLALCLAACHDDNVPAAPTISVQPSDTAAALGTAARLSVTASGPDIAYQWQVSADAGSTWSDIAGATDATYSTPPTAQSDDGKRYRVVVSAAGISVTSSVVTLTITPAIVAPAITAAPASASVVAPTPGVFHVTATGTALAYQWQRSVDGGATWNNVSGATAASLDSGATDTSMSGTQYRVIVSNAGGTATSAAATLSVSAAPATPAFATQPVDQSVAAGAAAAFGVAVTGTPTPTLQWQRSTDGGATWSNIGGATGATYNTGATTLSQDGERYRVAASNSAGTATSNPARLTVNAAPQAPAITAQPSDRSVTAPATATFTASASGVPTPAWQWQLSTDGGSTWANLNGATAATYTTPATVTGDSGKRYRAVATNASGSATTSGAVLTVLAAVATPQWGAATPLQHVGPAGLIKVAAGANGEFVVVWEETSSPWTLRSQRYLPATGWAQATTIDTTSAIPNGEFDVAMNPAGSTATIVWTDGSSTWVAQSGSDGIWSTTQALPQGGNYPGSQYPRVTMDSSGRAVAAWVATNFVSFGNYTFAVVATQFGGPANPVWSAPVAISAPTDRPDRLFMKGNANGDVVAAWVGNNAYTLGSFEQETIANVFHAATGWDVPTPLTDSSSASQGYPTDVAIGASGVAAVAYNFTSTVAGSVPRATVRRNAGGAWGTPIDLSVAAATAATPTTTTTSAQIALDASGLLIAAWTEGQAPSRVVAARETSPGAWSPGASLSANGEAGSVVVDANGNALVVWVDSVGGYLIGVKSARLAAGATTWSTLAGLPGADAEPTLPAIAVNPNGDVVAAWYDRPTYFPWANVFH